MPIVWWAATAIVHYFTTMYIGQFCILRATRVLISPIRLRPFGCIIVYYVFSLSSYLTENTADDHLFLWPHHVCDRDSQPVVWPWQLPTLKKLPIQFVCLREMKSQESRENGMRFDIWYFLDHFVEGSGLMVCDCVTGLVFLDFSQGPNSFIFKGWEIVELFFLDP